MKKNTLIILLFIAAIFASCSENKVTTSQSIGIINGKVLRAQDFTPIDSAKVTITPTNNSVFTNAKGEFSFTDVPVGDYSVNASKRGFLDKFEGASITDGRSVNMILDLEIATANNRPPTAPTLISPIDNAVNQPLSLELQWSATDPDDDPITYSIEVRNDKNNDVFNVVSLKDTTYTLSNLSYGVKYFWQVSASDDINEPVQSLVSSFETDPNPLNRFLYVRKLSNGNNVIYSSDSINTGFALTSESKNSWRPRKNNSANLIAFLQTTNTETHLFTMNTDGSGVKQVTSNIPVAGYNPGKIDFAWSDNGQELLYPNFDKLYRINKDGSGLQLVYQTPDGSLITECSWSHDSSFIALKTNDLNGYNVKIYTIDMAGNTIDTNLYLYDRVASISTVIASQKPAGTNDLDPRFSPNEAEIILVNTSNDGISERIIYKITLNSGTTSTRTLLYNDATMPDWE